MAIQETERVIQDFLGTNPRASEWRALRLALSERLLALRRQRRQESEAGADAARLHALDLQIAASDRQVAALETEEAVSQFVENSIMVTLAKAGPLEDGENEEF